MRSHDFERPAFIFTPKCLFSGVFIKDQRKTVRSVFLHDILRRTEIEPYLKYMTTASRSMLDYLVDNWRTRGDFFLVFNADVPPGSRDVVDLEELESRMPPDQEPALQEIKQYLNGYHRLRPKFASVLYTPPVPSQATRLSISIVFDKSLPDCQDLIKKILASKYQLQAYLYTVLVSQEGSNLITESMKSAVAAIMGRVNAHDFGHVLTHAKIESANIKEKAYFDHLTGFLRGLMVFGAEAATGDPVWSVTLPFVSQVVQGFTSTAEVQEDPVPALPGGWHGFEPSPLCKHLAQSENVQTIKVNVFLDGLQVAYLNVPPGNTRKSVVLESIQKDGTNTARDLYVSIPGGLIGAHAFYCILENVIRNGAKYGKNHGHELQLTIDVQTTPEKGCQGLLQVTVWDDHSIFDHQTKGIFETICGFCPSSSWPPYLRRRKDEKKNEKKNEKKWRIIDEQGHLVQGGWGIKEMRITAGWLRKERTLETLAQGDTYPRILTPVVVDGATRKAIEFDDSGGFKSESTLYMGYRFYMQKPKDVLIVDKGLRYESPLAGAGVEVMPDLMQALQERTPHRMWIVNLPAGPEGSRWLQTMKARRQQLPAAVMVRGAAATDKDAGLMPIPSALYGKMTGNDAAGQSAMLEAHQLWLREMLGAPNELSLILQISPGIGVKPEEAVRLAWGGLSSDFCAVQSGSTRWSICVGDEHCAGQAGDQEIIYDYHDIWASAHEGEERYFYEPFSGKSTTFSLIFNPPEDSWVRLRILMGLIEAAIATVAIVDERISNTMSYNRSGKLRRARILLPSEKLAKYSAPDADAMERLVPWCQKEGVRIIAVHQGMLDKAFNAKEDSIAGWVEGLKKVVPFVLVHSDRGEGLLPRLPPNVRFVPFSAIEPWFTYDEMSKYFLVQTLLSGTRREASNVQIDNPRQF